MRGEGRRAKKLKKNQIKKNECNILYYVIMTLADLSMDKISESLLLESIENKAVKDMEIRQTQEGVYELIVNLVWKETPSILATSRGSIRKWVSYERLMKHINENYSEISKFKITLNYSYLKKKTLLLPSVTEFSYDEVLIKSK